MSSRRKQRKAADSREKKHREDPGKKWKTPHQIQVPDWQDFYARNWAFVDPVLQAKLAQVTLFTAGTGGGSVVATLAARTGFQRFIVADGDSVERSNLNRQAFGIKQVGRNKAKCTAKQIRRIDPDVRIYTIPRFVSGPDFAELVAHSDIIVNTIDLSSIAFLELNRVAIAAGKSVLFPFNLGWGGALLVFTPDSMTLDDYLGIDPQTPLTPDVPTRLLQRTIEGLPGGAPPYLREALAKYVVRDEHSWPGDPQLGVGTHITAGLVVQAAVSLVAGWPVRKAPEVAWCDARVALAPVAVPAALDQYHSSPSTTHDAS